MPELTFEYIGGKLKELKDILGGVIPYNVLITLQGGGVNGWLDMHRFKDKKTFDEAIEKLLEEQLSIEKGYIEWEIERLQAELRDRFEKKGEAYEL